MGKDDEYSIIYTGNKSFFLSLVRSVFLFAVDHLANISAQVYNLFILITFLMVVKRRAEAISI